MQRKDVAKRLFVGDVEYVLWADAVAAVEAANARTERAEASVEALREAGLIWAQRVKELEAERDAAFTRLAEMSAHAENEARIADGYRQERDAAFVAGQEEMQAWAIVGGDGRVVTQSVSTDKFSAEVWRTQPDERTVQIAIRVIDASTYPTERIEEAQDAAYAAGQREMRDRASAEVRKVQFRAPTQPSGMFPIEVQEAIRALQIKDSPDGH